MKRIFTLALLCMISACAKSPDNIAAAQIEDAAYARHSCKSLSAEQLKQEQHLERISAKQKDAQAGDTIGVILIGVPVSSVAGNDNETDIAITKGKLQAIERQSAKKGC